MTSEGEENFSCQVLVLIHCSTSTTDGSLTCKKRKLTSIVWNDFEKVIIDGQDYAICKHCKSKLKADSKNGTKHLHQQLLAVERKGYGKVQIGGFTFDQDISREKDFASSLQPLFKMVSCNTIKDDIMKIYEFEKGKMSSYLEKLETRMAITTDMWTSNQKKGYMAITVHYIDESWLLHHHIVRFVYVPPPHTKEVLSDVLLDFLLDWNMDRKLSTITVDNCSKKLSSSGSLLLNGKIFHMRCATHVLNLIVKEGLDVIRVEIEKIRESVAYWSATPSRVEKFEDAARQLRLPCNKKLCLDLCEIKEALYDWLICSNEVVSTMASSMLEKFDKYWSGCHIVMAIAVVLDPRYKMKILEFYFPIMYGSEASSEIGKIRQLCYDLLSEYQSKSKMGQQTSSHGASSVSNLFELTYDEQDPLSKFDLFVHSTSEEGHAKSELDYYLEETVLPRISDFDVLSWWKTNGIKYPTLQMIARDIYAIPVSTVASESTFSTGGRMVSKHRSRLHPNTLEALMCAQSWLGNEMEGISAGLIDSLQALGSTVEYSACGDDEQGGLFVSNMGSSGSSHIKDVLHLYLVFEYMEHDLAVSPHTTVSTLRFYLYIGVKCYMQQLLRGLDHCHNHGVLHRDIKGSNLLIDNMFFIPSNPTTDKSCGNTLVPPPSSYLEPLTMGLWIYGALGCIVAKLYLGKPIMPEEQRRYVAKHLKTFLHRIRAYGNTSFHRSCDRGSATSTLKSEQLPCDPSSLPKYPPTKFDAKVRDEEARRDGENASPEATLEFLAKHANGQWQIDVDMYITHLKLYAHLTHILVGGCCTMDKGGLRLLQSPPFWSPFEWPLEVKLLDVYISEENNHGTYVTEFFKLGKTQYPNPNPNPRPAPKTHLVRGWDYQVYSKRERDTLTRPAPGLGRGWERDSDNWDGNGVGWPAQTPIKLPSWEYQLTTRPFSHVSSKNLQGTYISWKVIACVCIM
ncbi:hypothetical protein AAG906_022723 [Vitis piasezkii]